MADAPQRPVHELPAGLEYRDSLAGLAPAQMTGFFVGWPDPPQPETLWRILSGSRHVWLAFDPAAQRIVGFVNAVGDGVLAAYIPLLEVLPEYQGRGIGRELVRRMLASTARYYMTDLLCDAELQGFYAGLGMRRAHGMLVRRYERQSGDDYQDAR